MVIQWTIEVLAAGGMPLIVMLGTFDIEIGKPSQFTVDISFLHNRTILRHSCTFHLILFTGISFTPWLHENSLFLGGILVEKLLIVRMVLAVEVRGTVVVPLVPLILSWSQLSIVRVSLDDHFDICIEVLAIR